MKIESPQPRKWESGKVGKWSAVAFLTCSLSHLLTFSTAAAVGGGIYIPGSPSGAFTGSFTGNGAGLTNLDAGGTNKFYSGASLVGVTTNASGTGSNWIGGISLWNPATGNTINLTNGNITAVNLTNSGYSSTTTNYATKLRVGGAAETTDALNVTGSIRTDAAVTANSYTAAAGNIYSWTGRSLLSAPANGMVCFSDSSAIRFSHLLFGPGYTAATLALSTNYPALYMETTTNYPAFSVRIGTNVNAGIYGSLVASNITAAASLTATNFLALPTNYVAANFVPTAGLVKIVSSNGAIFSVTELSTNLIAGP